jgi:hypothetical protein
MDKKQTSEMELTAGSVENRQVIPVQKNRTKAIFVVLAAAASIRTGADEGQNKYGEVMSQWKARTEVRKESDPRELARTEEE